MKKELFLENKNYFKTFFKVLNKKGWKFLIFDKTSQLFSDLKEKKGGVYLVC